MVSVLDSGSSSPGASAGLGHCVKTLSSHNASLYQGVYMGTGDRMLGSNLRWTSIPSRGSRNTPGQLHVLQQQKHNGIIISSGSVGQFGMSVALPY